MAYKLVNEDSVEERSNLTKYLKATGMHIPTEVIFEAYANVDSARELCPKLTDKDMVREVLATEIGEDFNEIHRSEGQPGLSTVNTINALAVLASMYGETMLVQIQTNAISCKWHAVQSDIRNYFTFISGKNKFYLALKLKFELLDYLAVSLFGRLFCPVKVLKIGM